MYKYQKIVIESLNHDIIQLIIAYIKLFFVDDIVDPTKFSHVLTSVGNNQYDYNLTVVADPTVSGPYRAKFMLDPNVYTQAEVVILGLYFLITQFRFSHL